MSYDNSVVFTYTGTTQLWVKPIKLENVVFIVEGAGGGGSNFSSGGGGAYVYSNYTNLNPDISYNVYINVGQGGYAPPSSAIGDASGGFSPGYYIGDSVEKTTGGDGTTSSYAYKSGGGGGATSIFSYDASVNIQIIQIIAGGGGGGGINGGAGGSASRIGNTGGGDGGGQGGNTSGIGDGGLGGAVGGVNGYDFQLYRDPSNISFFKGGAGGNGGSFAGGGGGAGYGGGAGGKEGGGGGGGSYSSAGVNAILLNGGGSPGGAVGSSGSNARVTIYWNESSLLSPPQVPMYMLNPQHTGVSPYSASLQIPTSYMIKNIGGTRALTTPPAISADGEIYITTDDGSLYAYDHNFNFIWNLNLTGYSFLGTPAIISSNSLSTGGTIYLAANSTGGTGYLFAVINNNNLSVSEKWRFALDVSDQCVTTPTLDVSGIIYVGSAKGNIYAIEDLYATAALYFKYTDGSMNRITGPVALTTDSKTLCYTSAKTDNSEAYIYTLDLTDPRVPVLMHPHITITGEGYLTNPTIGPNGLLYVGTSDKGKVYAYDVMTNVFKWATDVSDSNVSSIAAASSQENVVFTTANKLNVLDSSNGTPLWEYPLAFDTVFTSQNTAPIIDASQNIYFGGKDSYLYSINSITRIFNWRFRNPTVTSNNQLSIPVIGKNQNIYYGDMVGNVYDLSGNDFIPLVTVPVVSMFMLNSAHSGISTYPNGIITPVTRSTYTDAQFVCNNLYILPGIAIDQSGVLYIGSDNGYLYAIRSNSPNPTMTLKWKKLLTATTPTPQVEKNLYTTPVAAPNGSIYVGSSEGILYAIDPSGATGTIKWQFNAGFRFQSSPIIDAFGTLYFGAGTRLYAMNDVGYQGYLKWFQPFEASGNILSSPALDASGTLYFGTDHDDGYVYAVNSTTGLAKWAAPTATNQPIFSSPTTDSSNNVIIGNGSDHGGNLYYLDTVDGHIRWTMQDLSGTNGPFYNTVAVLQNTIYLSTICGVYAINRQTGVRERTFQSTYYYYTAPTIDASGTIYVGAIYAGTDPAELNAGYLLALTDDGTTITSKWIYKVATRGRMAPPVISNDGNIYISSTDNSIYAIKNST